MTGTVYRKYFSTVTPGGTASQIVGAHPGRAFLMIINSGTVDVVLGVDATLTTNNGVTLAVGERLTDDASNDAWWAITASGSAELRILEVY